MACGAVATLDVANAIVTDVTVPDERRSTTFSVFSGGLFAGRRVRFINLRVFFLIITISRIIGRHPLTGASKRTHIPLDLVFHRKLPHPEEFANTFERPGSDLRGKPPATGSGGLVVSGFGVKLPLQIFHMQNGW
jgi:hypothetical protein